MDKSAAISDKAAEEIATALKEKGFKVITVDIEWVDKKRLVASVFVNMYLLPKVDVMEIRKIITSVCANNNVIAIRKCLEI